MSWLPGTATTGAAERAQERRRPVVLLAPAPVGQVAGRDDQFGLDSLRAERASASLENRVVARPEMQIRNVEDARIHRRSRLYSE